jgi:hypothetical protein
MSRSYLLVEAVVVVAVDFISISISGMGKRSYALVEAVVAEEAGSRRQSRYGQRRRRKHPDS